MEPSTSVTSQGQVTIPVNIRRYLGIKPADRVQFIKIKDKVYIKPAKDFLELKGTLKSKVKYTDDQLDKFILDHIADEYKKKANN